MDWRETNSKKESTIVKLHAWFFVSSISDVFFSIFMVFGDNTLLFHSSDILLFLLHALGVIIIIHGPRSAFNFVII